MQRATVGKDDSDLGHLCRGELFSYHWTTLRWRNPDSTVRLVALTRFLPALAVFFEPKTGNER